MLSEGWDVKNVCQIVPHEERAFNSKLLIAQVLGRGLRIPPKYKGGQPVVTVFNHDRWSSNIKHLVNEVLEIEKRIHSFVIPKDKEYNFEIHGIKYDKEPVTVETPMEKPYELLKKGFISLSSEDQTQRVEEETTYERAVTEKRREKRTLIEFKVYTAEEVAQVVYNRYRSWDMDENTNYAQEYPFDKILAIVRNSLKQKENLVNEKGRQKILQAFGVIKRKKSKSLRYKIAAENIFKINTADIKRNSLGIGALRRDSSIFYDDYSLRNGKEDDGKLLSEIIETFEDGQLHSASLIKVGNTFNFKTPLNIVFAAYKPERDFIKRLVREESAKKIDAWIKSPDVGFYSVEYSWQKGTHPKQGSFNPDFFIKIGNDILVVEIKTDEDISGENRAKLKYAREHFNRVNSLQSECRYYFKFLSPQSYDLFFQSLREGQYRDFKSEIEANLDVEMMTVP
jgi:type III restriction enzyme